MTEEQESKRLFIGIPIEVPMLSHWQDQWRQSIGKLPAGSQWVAAGKGHLTLHFLGDVPCDVLPKLCAQLKAVLESVDTFELEFIKVGIFPHERGRVVTTYARLSRILATVYQAISVPLQQLSLLQAKRSFRPHVTLLKLPDRIPDLVPLHLRPADKMQVREIVLYESQLGVTTDAYIQHEVYSLVS